MPSTKKFAFLASAVTDVFRETILAERRARGWSQRRLADAAGLRRETVVRLEVGRRPPTADTVFRLEHALDLEPGTLVPGWPEWSPIGTSSFGARSRERRRHLGLAIKDVAKNARVSIATLSRFERELAPTPSLARYEMIAGMPEAVELTSNRYARALRFSSIDDHRAYCLSAD